MSCRNRLSTNAVFVGILICTASPALAQEPVAPEVEAKYAAVLKSLASLPETTAEELLALDATVLATIKAFRAAGLDTRYTKHTDIGAYHEGLVELHRWLRVAARLKLSGKELAEDPFLDFTVKLQAKPRTRRLDQGWNGTLYPVIQSALTVGIPLAHATANLSAEDADIDAVRACPLIANGNEEDSNHRQVERMDVSRARMRQDPARYSASAARFIANVLTVAGTTLPSGLELIEPPVEKREAKPKIWGEPERVDAIPVRLVPPPKAWATIPNDDDRWAEYIRLRLEDKLQATMLNCALLADRFVIQAAATQLRASEEAKAAATARVLSNREKRNVILRSPLYGSADAAGKALKSLAAGEVVRVVNGLVVADLKRERVEAEPVLQVEASDGTVGWVTTTVTIKWRAGTEDREEEIEAVSEAESTEQAELARSVAVSAASYFVHTRRISALKKQGAMATDDLESAIEDARVSQDNLCRGRALYAWNYGVGALGGLHKDFRAMLHAQGESKATVEAMVNASFKASLCTP